MKNLIFLSFFLTSFIVRGQLVNNGATITIQSGATLHVSSSLTNNTISTIVNAGNIEVGGNLTNTGTINSNPASTVRFVGSTGSNVASGTAVFQNVVLDKVANDVTLTQPMRVAGNITFNADNNKIILGAHDLTLEPASSLISFDDNEYIVTNSTGSVVKIPNANGTFTFAVGDDNTDYSPLDMNFTAAGYPSNSNIKVRVIDAIHPNINTPLGATSYLSRYWDVDVANVTPPFNSTYTGTYVPSDAVGTAAQIEGSTYESSSWVHNTSSTNGTSTVTASSSNLNPDFSGRNRIEASLATTAFIEGFMATSTTMKPVLLNSGVAGATASQCDTITVALHNATSPYALAHTFKGILSTSGVINATFPPSSIGNSYYVVLKHRNSLETWSAAPVAISASSSYNFTTSASQAFGGNMVSVGGSFGLYSGDFNTPKDGNIDLIDFPIWQTEYDNFSNGGYFISDLNGDGNVDLIDLPIWNTNFDNFIFVQRP
jgi:hypothetical protein